MWNIEAGFSYEGFIKPVEVAFKYAGGNDDAQELGFPESRYGVAFNVDLFENVGVGVGYFHDDLEDNDNRDVFFGQVAIEFGLQISSLPPPVSGVLDPAFLKYR